MWMKVTVCIFLPDTHKANPPTHKYTQCLRYRKSKYELVEAATEAKSTPPPTFVGRGWGVNRPPFSVFQQVPPVADRSGNIIQNWKGLLDKRWNVLEILKEIQLDFFF